MKARHTLGFVVLVLGLLGAVSAFFPEEGVRFGGKTIYFLPFEEVLQGGEDRSQTALQRVQEIEESLRLQRYQDSIYADSLAFYTHFFKENPSRIQIPDGDSGYLDALFAALDGCRPHQKIVHILHYGDSQIESDRITGYIRQHLQDKFGGEGAGLLPAIQPLPSASVGQTASGNIERHIVSGMHQNRAEHHRYGVLGQVGELDGSSVITVASRNWKDTYEHVRKFQTIRLFVGRDRNLKAQLTSPAVEAVPEPVISPSEAVKVYAWTLPEAVNRVSLHLSGAAEVYGLAADGIAGVAVDNVPFRGSSGTFFNTLDSAVMADMFRELNTQLILLEFGGNMLPSIRGPKSIAAYREQLSEQIAYLRKVCPEAKVLLIGPSDMSTKVNGKLSTYPYLEPLIEAMQAAALHNGAAFWNLYEVMGGRNSMIDWVKHSPALAAPDYIHFTVRGAERVATLFCETLMVYYDYYRFTNASPQTN